MDGTRGTLRPRARTQGLLVEDMSDETLVYDLHSHEAHCLNRTAALVWHACDGATGPEKMARRLRQADLPADARVVSFALERLQKADLLEDAPAPEPGVTRKELLRILGKAAALTVLLPAVTSIRAPLAAQAASCVPLASCTYPPACSQGLPICENRTVCCKRRGSKKCKVVTC